MFEWIKRTSAPLSLKCTLACGSLNAGSNWHKSQMTDRGHKNLVKRHKSASAELKRSTMQKCGYKDTACYKYTSSCNIMNNTKTFYGNNIEMVKKLAENHYRQILKLAVLEANPRR